MPKKILFESAVHQFAMAAKDLLSEIEKQKDQNLAIFRNCASSWKFSYNGPKQMLLKWDFPQPGESVIEFPGANFYVRGDSETFIKKQNELFAIHPDEDPVSIENKKYFKGLVREALEKACRTPLEGTTSHSSQPSLAPSLATEETFHDDWAESQDIESIDVVQTFTACTSPELRKIFRELGNLEGKRVLDVGCGLGEASVFFALKGAKVTATDLSGQMLAFTERLAKKNGVKVRTHKASADSLNFPEGEKFDVIYVGNLFHHVDIEKTLILLKGHLAPEGTLASWDPLAYNPLINVYRRMATDVRTPDEHPLTLKDLKTFRKHFRSVTYQYYWLTTLAVFILMYLFQKLNPNEVRYWKKVVQDAPKWEPLYRPLEFLDRILLKVFPPLRMLCWNVVIFARGAK